MLFHVGIWTHCGHPVVQGCRGKWQDGNAHGNTVFSSVIGLRYPFDTQFRLCIRLPRNGVEQMAEIFCK
jgi:hypothetical protein